MSEPKRISKAAQDAADKVLAAIYGEDLAGCTINPDTVSVMIQQGIDTETKDYRQLAEALIGAIEQIRIVATPPNKSEVTGTEELVQLLGNRADAIHDITTKILQAWAEFKANSK